MNSYTLTDKLRKSRRKHKICAGAQALFYELIAICNEEQWANVFLCRNQELCLSLCLSEKTLISYRDILAEAGLLIYVSGQANHEPCSYTLNGCTNGLPNGLLNGGKIYSSPVSQTDSRSVENVTDLNKTKRETKTKLKLEVVAEGAGEQKKSEKQQEFEAYLDEFDKNSNAALPDQAYLPDERKEKSCAQKEKEFPALAVARENVLATAAWRNVLEHHQVSEQEREELFKLFYEQKEDAYRIRYPTANDMASHFYFWISARQRLEILRPKLGITNENTGTYIKQANRKRTEELKHDIRDFINQSTEFVRKSAG